MVKIINNYTLIERIGQGSYGQVFRALNSRKTGQFAVKVIPVERYQENNMLELCTINEVQTLSTIGPCQFIVKYQEHFQTKNNYYFVYQFCNGGTLLQAIKKEGLFPEKKALIVFRQLLQAFKVLNRFNIMHRDIKPQNIFFHNNKIKLGDFGFCKGLKPGQHMAKTMLGSPIYMAPQVLRGQNYTTKADIWSLGVVLYQMLFGVCPFQSKSIAMLISTIKINEITLPTQANSVSEKTQNLIKKLLTKDYFRRISWIQLFGYKIDEQGSYVEHDSISKSPYNNSNRSYSGVKQQSQSKGLQNSAELNIKPTSKPRQEAKMKFYSQKYMNAVMQPLQGKGTQKKISFFATQSLIDRYSIKEESNPFKQKKSSSDKQIDIKALEITQIPQQLKRNKLLKMHEECVIILNQTLVLLQKRQIQYIGQCYLALNRIHSKLKQITESIKVTETDLLDVASLINYEIIQIDRQMIETKQELMRRKLEIPKYQKLPIKSLQSGFPSTPDKNLYTTHSEIAE